MSEEFLDTVLRCGLYFGALFQLICIAAVIIIPENSSKTTNLTTKVNFYFLGTNFIDSLAIQKNSFCGSDFFKRLGTIRHANYCLDGPIKTVLRCLTSLLSLPHFHIKVVSRLKKDTCLIFERHKVFFLKM